jgi:hypothetical protein
MTTMDTIAYSLLIAIGNCHGLLKNHAAELVSRSVVKAVKHWFDISSLQDAVRLEEYVDAELVDGEAVSWCLELTITLEGVAVEADVRRVHRNGQDVLLEIADRKYENVLDCSKEIIEITQTLCAGARP